MKQRIAIDRPLSLNNDPTKLQTPLQNPLQLQEPTSSCYAVAKVADTEYNTRFNESYYDISCDQDGCATTEIEVQLNWSGLNITSP
jgi:hypothetical protein